MRNLAAAQPIDRTHGRAVGRARGGTRRSPHVTSADRCASAPARARPPDRNERTQPTACMEGPLT